ncbi:PadR family transcriptional regulator [Actinomadura yumaensis]|uniref:PadR family transcriptional regulator n=2 Tax=Thermomonosporaceae TaxID=2012 RepID=A0ABW2CI04_9ACTN
MNRESRPSPLGLVVLGLLLEARMHPYEMQRLLKERQKERVVNIGQRSSFYQTINRLQRDGLIVAHRTVREGTRPDRTVYEITDEGRRTFHGWLRRMLAAPRDVFPDFPVAVSYLPLLEMREAVELLETRRDALADELSEVEAALAAGGAVLPRLMLLEEELRRDVVAAELRWLSALVDDIDRGRITWSAEALADQIARLSPPRTT